MSFLQHPLPPFLFNVLIKSPGGIKFANADVFQK